MDAEDEYYLKIFLRYIILTFLISWTIWSMIWLLDSDNYLTNLWIGVIGLYGPSIAGIILSFRYQGTYWQHYLPNRIIFPTVLVVSGSLAIGYMLEIAGGPNTEITPGVIFLIVIASLLTAYLIGLMKRSPPGFETRNEEPLQLKSQLGMIIFALSLPLIIGLISYSIQVSFSNNSDYRGLIEQIDQSFQYPIFLLSFTFFFSGASNEEIGWRGYLTPKLLQRINPLATGLLIGIFWSIWHLPLHIFGFYGGGIEGIWFRLLWNTPMGIVFTWYYMKSGYNLLGAILLHGAFNLFSFIGDFYIAPAYLLTATIMIIESKMWQTNYVKPNSE